MSMRDYSFHDYGIVLNNIVNSNILDELVESDIVDVQFSFTGEAFPLDDEGSPLWSRGTSFDDEVLYYVALPKAPRFFEAAYENMDALVAGMLDRYHTVRKSDESQRLPVLTAKKIRELLRMIDGTYYG